MAKLTQLAKAIASLEADIIVLQLAIAKLRAQQVTQVAPAQKKRAARLQAVGGESA